MGGRTWTCNQPKGHPAALPNDHSRDIHDDVKGFVRGGFTGIPPFDRIPHAGCCNHCALCQKAVLYAAYARTAQAAGESSGKRLAEMQKELKELDTTYAPDVRCGPNPAGRPSPPEPSGPSAPTGERSQAPEPGKQ